VGRLLIHAAFIARPLADVLHIGEKKCEKKHNLRITPYTQTEDVLCNPENPVNPDSKPDESG